MNGSGPVLTRTEGRVGWVILNRPEVMNAVNLGLAQELQRALTRLAPEVDVIVIRGAGGNFCAGGDVDEVQRLRAQGRSALAGLFESFGRALALIGELDVPVISAVEGYATAGGFELMQASDIAIVSEEARIADIHSNFGQVPGGGSSQRLPRLVGRQRALALILTGDRLSGTESVSWGLAYRAVPAGELEAAARALAQRLAEKSREALAHAKRLVHRGLELPLAEGLALEREVVVAHITGSAGTEAIAAFREREGR